MLAERIDGESRVKFTNDSKAREFDAVSNEYIAQSKPALGTLNKGVREQLKATFEAAKQTNKKVYYQFDLLLTNYVNIVKDMEWKWLLILFL